MKRTKWPMTPDEIKRSWRCCENQHEQIKILAQLNCCTTREIVEHMREIGIEVEEQTVRERVRFTIREDRKMWQLREAGEPYKKIAAVIGNTHYGAVKNRIGELRKMRREAGEAIITACRVYMANDLCSEDERKQLNEILRRGLI